MRISVRHIQEVVAADFGLSSDEIRSNRKLPEQAHPRQVAMYLARELTPLSLPSIGRIFDRDHSTIVHGIRATKSRISSDRSLALKIEARKLLLQCEPNKTVEGQAIGFIGLSASPDGGDSHTIHRGFHGSILDDRTAVAA
jgi:hypothetical protein